MRRVAAVSALAAWMALLGGTLVLLHSLPPATGAAGDGSAFVMAAVRYLAIGLGWYLAISTLGSSIAQLVRSQQAIDIAERVTAAPVGRLTRLALGAAFVAGALAPTAATAQAPEHVPVMTWVADDPAPQPGAPSPAPPQQPAPAVANREVVVEPGQHLWAIASTRLAQHLGREPSDREITPYWLEVIRANRSNLREPSLPDLIYPGDRLVLPPL